MKNNYLTFAAIIAASVLSLEAEAKRKKVENVAEQQKPALDLTLEEENRYLVQIYHTKYNSIEKEGKKAQRDYDDRLKKCTDVLIGLDFCSKDRLGALEQTVAAHQRDLDEWTLDYSVVSGLSNEAKEQLKPLLIRYKTDCADKRGKANTAYCQELGVGIFDEGAKLSAARPAR